jgi:hypothetical protein
MMNIKENFYIYLHKHSNTLIDEQKMYENNDTRILFDIAIQYTDNTLIEPPTRTQNTHTLTLPRNISLLKHPAQNTTNFRLYTHEQTRYR